MCSDQTCPVLNVSIGITRQFISLVAAIWYHSTEVNKLMALLVSFVCKNCFFQAKAELIVI